MMGGNHPGEAAGFDVEDIVNGLARGASNAKGDFAGGSYRNADQARLCGRRDKGKLCLWGGREKIQKKVRRETIRDIGRKIKVVFPDCSVSGVRSNCPGDRVDEDVHGLGE